MQRHNPSEVSILRPLPPCFQLKVNVQKKEKPPEILAPMNVMVPEKEKEEENINKKPINIDLNKKLQQLTHKIEFKKSDEELINAIDEVGMLFLLKTKPTPAAVIQSGLLYVMFDLFYSVESCTKPDLIDEKQQRVLRHILHTCGICMVQSKENLPFLLYCGQYPAFLHFISGILTNPWPETLQTIALSCLLNVAVQMNPNQIEHFMEILCRTIDGFLGTTQNTSLIKICLTIIKKLIQTLGINYLTLVRHFISSNKLNHMKNLMTSNWAPPEIRKFTKEIYCKYFKEIDDRYEPFENQVIPIKKY